MRKGILLWIVICILRLATYNLYGEVLAADNFETGNFDGGTGWLEPGWGLSDTGILCYDGNEPLGLYHVRLQQTDQALTRSVNLSGKTDVYLRFTWKGDFLEDNAGRAYVEVNDNQGSGWVDLFSFNNSDSLYYGEDINLATISGIQLSDYFTLRMRLEATAGGNYAYFDSIKFETLDVVRITDFSGVPDLTPTSLPPNSSTPTPCPLTTLRLEAEDYTAFYDTTTGNAGGALHSDDVDIEACHDGTSDSGYAVSWTVAGEWLEWQVTFPVSAYYTIGCRIARAPAESGAIHLEMAGQDVTGPLSVPSTGGGQLWAEVVIGDLYIPAGSFPVRFVLESDDVNLNYMYFTTEDAASSASHNS